MEYRLKASGAIVHSDQKLPDALFEKVTKTKEKPEKKPSKKEQ